MAGWKVGTSGVNEVKKTIILISGKENSAPVSSEQKNFSYLVLIPTFETRKRILAKGGNKVVTGLWRINTKNFFNTAYAP